MIERRKVCSACGCNVDFGPASYGGPARWEHTDAAHAADCADLRGDEGFAVIDAPALASERPTE